MWNWFRRNKTEENNNDKDTVEVEETDSVGNVTGKKTMTRQEADAAGFSYQEKEKTVKEPEVPVGSRGWWNRAGRPQVENFTLEEETRSPEQNEKEADRAAEAMADMALGEAAARAEVPVEAKLEMSGPEAKQELEGEIRKQKFFGRKSVDALVGFAAGAFTAKALTAWGAKTAIKRSFDLAVPGMGAVGGAVAGGSYELYKSLKEEKKRERAGLELLHGEYGPGRIAEILNILENEGYDSLQNNPEAAAVYEKYANNKVNRKKIAKAVVRGALIGGIGGYAGGYLAEKFLGGVSYVAESFAGDAVQTGAKETAKSFAYDHTEAGTKKLASIFESKVVSVPGGSVDTQEMHGSVWNTVKEYLKSHGIEKPSNNLVNEATRIITAENSVEITSDAAPAPGNVKDIAMAKGFKLGGFEKLSELITNAGGEVVEQAKEVTLNAPVDLPKAGYFPQTLMSEVTTISEKTLRTVGAVVLVLGSGAAAIAAARKFAKRDKKESLNEVPVVPEKTKQKTIKIAPAPSKAKQQEEVSVRTLSEIADEQIVREAAEQEERRVQEGFKGILEDIEIVLAGASDELNAGNIDEAADNYQTVVTELRQMEQADVNHVLAEKRRQLQEQARMLGERIQEIQNSAGEAPELAPEDEMIEGRTRRYLDDCNSFIDAVRNENLHDAEMYYAMVANIDAGSIESNSPEVKAMKRDVQAAVVEALKQIIGQVGEDFSKCEQFLKDGAYEEASFYIKKLNKILSRSTTLTSQLLGPAFNAAAGTLARLIDTYNERVNLSERFVKEPIIEMHGKLSSLRAAVNTKDIPSALSLSAYVVEYPRLFRGDEFELLVGKARTLFINHAKKIIQEAENARFQKDISEAKKKVVEAENLLQHVIFKDANSAEQVALLAGIERLKADIAKSATDQKAIEDIPEVAPLDNKPEPVAPIEESPSPKPAEEKKELAKESIAAEMRARFERLEGFIERLEGNGERLHIPAGNLLRQVEGMGEYAKLRGESFALYNVLRREVVQRLVNAHRGEFARRVWEKLAPGAEFDFEIQKKRTSRKKKEVVVEGVVKKRTPKKKVINTAPESVPEPELPQEPEQEPVETVQEIKDVSPEPEIVSAEEVPEAEPVKEQLAIKGPEANKIINIIEEGGFIDKAVAAKDLTSAQGDDLQRLLIEYRRTGDKEALADAIKIAETGKQRLNVKNLKIKLGALGKNGK